MLYVSEYEAPHKLTAPHLRAGLHPMNIFADVVNRKTIPTAADLIARFEYHAERLTAAAITQTYNYMIEGGLEYGLLTTGEAIIFLRVDWQDPETLLYHLAEPSFEMADRSADKCHACTARSSRGRDHKTSGIALLRVYVVGQDFETTLRSIPSHDPPAPPSLASSYAPTTHGRVSRSPLVARRKARGSKTARDRPERQARRRKSDESSSDEAGRPVPGSRSPSERRTNAVQQSQRSELILARGWQGQQGQGSQESQESQQYCTHKCLLGLAGRGRLDERCPNTALHRQGITKLHPSGTRGALFKVTFLAFGYTFVVKGTVSAFVPVLQHEVLIYERLERQQGTVMPVCLGTIDLRPLHRVYYYDHRVYIEYLLLLSRCSPRSDSATADQAMYPCGASGRPQLTRPSFTKAPRRSDKEREEKLFRAWLAERDEQNDLTVYSDAAQIKEHGLARTGWGYSIRKGGTMNEIYRGKGRLHQAEVVDAEVHGAMQGLAAARAIGRHKRIYVCLDNTAVVDGLNGTPLESSQSVFLRFQELAAAHAPDVIVNPHEQPYCGRPKLCTELRCLLRILLFVNDLSQLRQG
ncbi:hypothetical protein JX266_014115 [Neoarthrinium moseri]|nr:hypothetical protein JX266_014115 [Neoarthrinium moseri]